MKKALYKRKRFWGIIVVVLFFLSLTVSNYVKYIDNKYLWEIVAISGANITIMDRKTWSEVIQILDSTRFINADQTDNPLKVWDNVMIVSSNPGGILSAKSIRVLVRNKNK